MKYICLYADISGRKLVFRRLSSVHAIYKHIHILVYKYRSITLNFTTSVEYFWPHGCGRCTL